MSSQSVNCPDSMELQSEEKNSAKIVYLLKVYSAIKILSSRFVNLVVPWYLRVLLYCRKPVEYLRNLLIK